ncbi:MAG: hypothetical protein IIZ67_00870, partial [Bacilli bacterium]|nr:hypothetical protein [Bacilli bacterium]
TSVQSEIASIESEHDGLDLNSAALQEIIENVTKVQTKVTNLSTNLLGVVKAFTEAEGDIKEAILKIDPKLADDLNNIKKEDISTDSKEFQKSLVSYKSDGTAAGETQASIYKILREKGYSKAAICAILANMEHESSFRKDALGDYENGQPTSYGLCQWHAGRWTKLKNFCSDNGYDVASIEGQLAYMDHELQTDDYKYIYDKLMSVDDTIEGAKEASKYWTIHFEVPKHKEQRAVERAESIGKYWERAS